MNEPREFLTARQVADMLALSPASVLRRWRGGELPGYRLGSNVLRFKRSELDEWLDARHQHVDDYAPGSFSQAESTCSPTAAHDNEEQR
jgi:excisionase family DNA binding protein